MRWAFILISSTTPPQPYGVTLHKLGLHPFMGFRRRPARQRASAFSQGHENMDSDTRGRGQDIREDATTRYDLSEPCWGWQNSSFSSGGGSHAPQVAPSRRKSRRRGPVFLKAPRICHKFVILQIPPSYYSCLHHMFPAVTGIVSPRRLRSRDVDWRVWRETPCSAAAEIVKSQICDRFSADLRTSAASAARQSGLIGRCMGRSHAPAEHQRRAM